jgi:cytochrome c
MPQGSTDAHPAQSGAVAKAGGAALLQTNSCLSCHGMTHKIVGPALQDVAKKYAGRADVVEYLAAKIRKGGQGVWGSIPMPEQSQLSEADAKAIASWLGSGAQ